MKYRKEVRFVAKHKTLSKLRAIYIGILQHYYEKIYLPNIKPLGYKGAVVEADESCFKRKY